MVGMQHISKRKRIHLKKEAYPNPRRGIRWLDNFLLIVAVLGPLITLPQIIEIYFVKNVSGVSIITWGLFALGAIPWVIYGFVHKEKPIIISYALWFVLALLIVVGVLFYG